jgi:hypothetical protein
MEDCKTLVSKCHGYLLHTGYLLQGLDELLKLGKDDLIKKVTNENQRKAIRLAHSRLKSKSLESFIDYVSEFEEKESNPALEIKICDMVFDLVKPTIFQATYPLIRFIFKYVDDFLVIFKIRWKKQFRKKNRARRLFKTHLNVSRHLKICSTRTRRSCSHQATGLYNSAPSRTIQDSSNMKPVNLSLIFP